MVSKKSKEHVWEKAEIIKGKNPNLWRKDEHGNIIYKPAYGTHGKHGWEVDHKRPKSKDGSEHLKNKRALHTKANRQKGNKYPFK